MSRKSPTSAKSPVSNSPSCSDIFGEDAGENERPKSALDRLQRQVEEELRKSNRLLSTIDGLIAESKGNISEKRSRPRTPCNESNLNVRTSSRASMESEICSLPHTSIVYNEETEELDPPLTTIKYGFPDRDGSRVGSKRGTRAPSPESYSIKSRPQSPSMLKNQDSSYIEHHSNEARSPSPAIYMSPQKGSKDSSCVGSAQKMSHHTPREQLSFNENKSPSNKSFTYKTSFSKYLNESSEPQEQSISRERGMRASSPRFASTPIMEIMKGESSQDHHSWYLPRSDITAKTQFQARTPCNDGETSSSGFDSVSIKELTMAEPSQGHHGRCSPGIYPKIQFPSYDENMRTSKVRSDHYHHYRSIESPQDHLGRDERTTAALDHLSQLRKNPSYFRCKVQQDTDFLNVCCPKTKDSRRAEEKVAELPKVPCLRSEDIDDLIKCETCDVESVWYLTSDEKKTHKKPCPKQQKAQLSVKSIVQTSTAQAAGVQIYAPLEHPDPDDILPEVAAAMMFSQEQGIRMEECPNAIIAHLFPDETQSMISEKVQGGVSVVDPNQKDQEEMIEKSAAVPSEGVSDSAYTRVMRDKGEGMKIQRPYDMDFAVCQSKPEYVLVTQKPQRVNKVQFRGNLPSWFPGYFSAFPDDEGLKVVSSPSGLFDKAWIYSNPENIPASDVIVLE